MKKSTRNVFHFIFWAFFPIGSALDKWSGQFGFMKNLFNPPKTFFQIFSENIQSFFIRPDIGSPVWTISNLFGIFFHIFTFILLPIGVFYLFYGLFIPKILVKKNLAAMLMPTLFLIFAPIIFTSLFSLVTIRVAWEFTHSLTITYLIAISFAILGSLFKILENWIRSEKLIKQNLQSELALLKSQVNPHFFFNTLNNIDSLIKSNTDKASEMLVKLAEIMRYMIYETNIEKVNFSNEINHLRSYIDLQKIQFPREELVSFSIKGNHDNILISPMLFIPFIENAFKHCTNKNVKHAIRISFTIQNKLIDFKCENTFDKTKQLTKDPSSGVGLNLVKRRLKLTYPGKHNLVIKEKNNTFQVILLVDTNED